MNPSANYSGTRDLNKALLSRFPIVIQTRYPNPVQEAEIIKSHAPKINSKDSTLMLRVAEAIRKGQEEDSISLICSTRELINWAKLSAVVGMKESARLALLNKCETPEDFKTVEDILKMQFGAWDSNKIVTLTEMQSEVQSVKAKLLKIKKQYDELKDKELQPSK
jgi:MoxR-like ATPase